MRLRFFPGVFSIRRPPIEIIFWGGQIFVSGICVAVIQEKLKIKIIKKNQFFSKIDKKHGFRSKIDIHIRDSDFVFCTCLKLGETHTMQKTDF